MAGYFSPQNGYLGEDPSNPTFEVMLFEGQYHKVRKMVVHQFSVGDVDDPDLYAGQPLWDWQQTDAGKWIMKHAIETPSWHRHIDYLTYGTKYTIVAKLKDVDYTFWALKWGTK
jgi:hypothetical protein